MSGIKLRVVVTPAVVLLLGDLTGLQFGRLFPPGPKHFVQPGSILVFAKIYLQGKLILGEAIADVGGLQLAIEALKQSSPDDLDAELEDLLVNFARAERGSARHERLVELAKTDPHPPSRFRVNCVVNHIDDFYDLYDVRPSDALYLMPENRAQIW